MSSRDRLLAVAVAVSWGLNFPAIHLSLQHFPPFFLVALRFALIAVPTVLLVPRPAVRLRWLLGYGLGFGVLQFTFLYLAMDRGMPTGLASLVLQSSAPFTVALGALLLRERVSPRQTVGVLVAVAGLGGIAAHRAVGMPEGAAAVVPVLLTLCGALGWALGNLANRQAAPDSPLRLMLWMSVVPPLPMLALSLLVEGPQAGWDSLRTAGAAPAAVLGLLYTVGVATVFGSGAWTALMKRYPSGTVAPFSMLVPVVGILAAWLVLGERPVPVELAMGTLVIAGVLIGSGAAVRFRRPTRPDRPVAAETVVRS